MASASFREELQSAIQGYLDGKSAHYELRHWLGLHISVADACDDDLARELANTVFGLHIDFRMDDIDEPTFRRYTQAALALTRRRP